MATTLTSSGITFPGGTSQTIAAAPGRNSSHEGNGTFTATGNIIEVSGTGGAGGSSGNGNYGVGGKGGSGAFMDGALITVVSGTTYTVAIGGAGNAGAATNNSTNQNGGAGTATTIKAGNTTIVSLGGGGGGVENTTTGLGPQGAAGTVSGNSTGAEFTRSAGANVGMNTATGNIGMGGVTNGPYGNGNATKVGTVGSVGFMYILY